ncbi:prokaryotic molybdopterin-containing oxidoreductase family, membrane subunit [Flavobacterium noncentrifugens]|uniref:Prokaryotic molybdopterin-containing oxidoreductase family, membrane subunit n=1 Tax=Flavobacterium noncentrifugens TaxID=1128970 RepID=A0A1G8UR01_9FLAO|nr:prokaryotic molybdopterin-containing oxidoreductase family, membrane subunit [Flavobacterium noncentrifugens]
MQLLQVKKIRKNVLLRILFSLLLIISIERFIIIVTSFHRNYLPSSWTMYSSLEIFPSNFILDLIAKIIYFLVFVGIFTLAELNVKKLINIKTTANNG